MGKPKLYPLKFYPHLKEKVWGGTKLISVLGKKGNGKLGESWELSGVKNHISVVKNGALKGEDLNMLIKEYGSDLLGTSVVNKYGKEFPLLFKFIDAKEDLSVQLHPDDDVAQQRHKSFGKTEMWYIQQAEKDARLILGFNQKMDRETYLDHLSKNTIPKILHAEKVNKGDAFFIAPGTVHAIGAGVLLAEIQQTSDITYRIYDWDRPDLDGSLRELHTDLALDVITFEKSNAKLNYSISENDTTSLCKSDYFETNIVKLTKPFQKDISSIESFIVYMCVEGSASIYDEPLRQGETLLVPACFQNVFIETEGATLLEVYVP